ncbi:MAG TPA: F0F1 ATP synthase subunit A [Rhodanobacteraceae bacterium]
MAKPPGGESFSEYIQHHLTFWTSPAHGGVWSVNVDTLTVSCVIGAIFLLWFWWLSSKATSGVPSKAQAFIELAVEFVDGQVKDAWHGSRRFLGPLALTLFFWILLMSLLDVVPVDFIPSIAEGSGATFFRPVPTADANATFGMSITVLIITLFCGFKAKGVIGYPKGLLTGPFKADGVLMKIVLAPANLLMAVIEITTQPLSLALRLFGNIFAGELLFMLLAGLMSHFASIWYPLGIIGYAAWSMVELLIIFIQAFIFMYLSVTYITMAQESH